MFSIKGTDLKDGKSMTDSGYPRVMREWHRGTSLLQDSVVVHEGEQSDVSVYMYMSKHKHHKYLVKGRAITFYTSTNSVFIPSSGASSTVASTEGEWRVIQAPADAEISVFGDQLLVKLRSEWTVGAGVASRAYAQGSLLAVSLMDFITNVTAGKDIYI